MIAVGYLFAEAFLDEAFLVEAFLDEAFFVGIYPP
jgi:hypothetical protein